MAEPVNFAEKKVQRKIGKVVIKVYKFTCQVQRHVFSHRASDLIRVLSTSTCIFLSDDFRNLF